MYKYGKIVFEWDDEKEAENLLKHGVSFLEAIESFSDPKGFQLDDDAHSESEVRHYWVGMSSNDRVLTTYRKNNIRIIGSAEWRKFRKFYYERAKN